MVTPVKKAGARKEGGKKEDAGRPVLYDEIIVNVCRGEDAITVEQAKEILGWETEEDYVNRITAPPPGGAAGPTGKAVAVTAGGGEEDEGGDGEGGEGGEAGADGKAAKGKNAAVKGGAAAGAVRKPDVGFGSNYLLTDLEGRKVRCWNNTNNRPLYRAVVEVLKQEHLMRRWRFNGEPIIVGKTGLVLNGQHQLIALILAEQERTGPDGGRWNRYWKTPVTMEKMVVRGIEEDDGTVNTMDTCKSRSLADVVFRSEYFANLGMADRRAASRMSDYAIRFLWHRTGADRTEKAVRRTHSESLDFLARHGHLLRAVQAIIEMNRVEKDDDGKPLPAPIGKYLNPGYAAGLLYLMACSGSDGEQYRKSTTPSERKLDWSRWDKAVEFWDLLGAGATDFRELRYALGGMANEDGTPGTGTFAEKVAVLCKAWNHFVEGTVLSAGNLELETHEDEDGIRHIVDTGDLNVGGIDLGDVYRQEEPEPPSEDELELRKEEERVRRQEEEAEKESRAQTRREKNAESARKRRNTASNAKAMAAASAKNGGGGDDEGEGSTEVGIEDFPDGEGTEEDGAPI